MALHIRDDRALRLAKELAGRKGVTMTQAVLDALESALAREGRPLSERLHEIAQDASRLGDPARRGAVTKQEVDELWDNS